MKQLTQDQISVLIRCIEARIVSARIVYDTVANDEGGFILASIESDQAIIDTLISQFKHLTGDTNI